MNSYSRILIFGSLFFIIHQHAWTQGTISFSNVSLNAPFSVNGEPAGSGYFARLELADGTSVGARTEFFAEGLFSGGTRVIEGHAGGSNVSFRVLVEDSEGNPISHSNTFSVTLGGSGFPPTTPSRLTGLEAWNLAEAAGVQSVPEQGSLRISRVTGGQFEIRWPEGTTLEGAKSLASSSEAQTIEATTTEDKIHVAMIEANETQWFFWLVD